VFDDATNSALTSDPFSPGSPPHPCSKKPECALLHKTTPLVFVQTYSKTLRIGHR
jgi:hypothetical protein